MKADLEKFSEEELMALNHEIVRRLKFFQHMKTQKKMLQYRIGERVSFLPIGRPVMYGTLVRFNRKSVTIITEDGGHWNVAPSLIRRSPGKSDESKANGKVVALFPQNGP